MTIRREYRLPNCSLILEGWSDEPSYASANDRPTLSVLVNVECHFSSQNESSVLKGDRDFLESLVRVVNSYAQWILSELELDQPQDWVEESVRIEPIPETNRHRLQYIYQDKSHLQQTQQVDLTTVELFDLVEAIDQLLNDGSTLPELSLSLKPHSRKVRRRTESVTQQAAPALAGVASLAVAAIGFSLIEPPAIEPEPESREEETFPGEDPRRENNESSQ